MYTSQLYVYAYFKYAYACIEHAHVYIPRNIVLKQATKRQSNKTYYSSNILIQLFIQNMVRHNKVKPNKSSHISEHV